MKDNYFEGKKSIDPNRSDDKLQIKARKPYFKKLERSLSLNFGGRVKKASKKNIQIVSNWVL